MMAGGDLPVPSVTDFQPPRMEHRPASTERKTHVPASSSSNDLGQSLHLSPAAHLTPCIDRCMAGGLLSDASVTNDGACHPSCEIAWYPARMVSRLREYAIQGGHLSDTVGYRKKTHYAPSCGKRRIWPDFPRMLSVHSNVSSFVTIDYGAVLRGTNNLFRPRPLPKSLPSYIDRAGVHSSSGGCIVRKRNISVLLSY